MLNKKQTATISLELLQEDLERIDDIIEQYPAFETRSDFIRIAIKDLLKQWEF